MRGFVTAIAVAGVMLGAVPSIADPTADEALAHLDRGIAAYRARDFAEADRELTAAQQLAPDRPNPYRWLALDEVELGDCKAALVNIESFLSRVAAGDPRVAEMVKLRQRCILEVAAAKPAPAPAPAPAPTPAPSTPITHEWWLWTAIGVAALGAGLTAYFVERDHTNELPTITCTATSCTP